MNTTATILLALGLLLLNALFVGAEFALLSSRKDRLEALRDQGVSRARTVIKASQEGSLMLASAQLGITLCSLGLGATANTANGSTTTKLSSVGRPSIQPVFSPHQ